jgi:hypothetical protein
MRRYPRDVFEHALKMKAAHGGGARDRIQIGTFLALQLAARFAN